MKLVLKCRNCVGTPTWLCCVGLTVVKVHNRLETYLNIRSKMQSKNIFEFMCGSPNEYK